MDFCEQYGYDLPYAANKIIVASKRGLRLMLCGGGWRLLG